MESYLDRSIAKLEEFEGCVPWMYRDTVGRVTVGVGLMLPDAQAAQALPFLAGSQMATPAEAASEFARIHAMPMAREASFYKVAGSLELTQETIHANLRMVLEGFEDDLRKEVSQYDGLPDGVKMALLDMVYNLGPAGLFRGFPHLMAAVKAGEWAQAASCCARRGPGPVRNAWTREQFLGAVSATIKAEAEGWAVRTWHRLRLTLVRIFGWSG